jgi:hypothetical protein
LSTKTFEDVVIKAVYRAIATVTPANGQAQDTAEQVWRVLEAVISVESLFDYVLRRKAFNNAAAFREPLYKGQAAILAIFSLPLQLRGAIREATVETPNILMFFERIVWESWKNFEDGIDEQMVRDYLTKRDFKSPPMRRNGWAF